MVKYHSQLKQDKWICETVFPGLRNGFFIDVGAHDGIYLSNTYVLEKEFGWNGVCVEAHPDLFKSLTKNRSCKCVNAVAWKETGFNIKFSINKRIGSGLSGVSEKLSNCVKNSTKSFYTVHLRTKTLASILKNINVPSPVHYLSIDVEGSELEVLAGYPWYKQRPIAVTIEHNEKIEKTDTLKNSIRKFMKDRGYKIARELPIEDWFLLS